MSSTTVSRTVSSIVGGRAVTDAPGGRVQSTNPADTSEVVAEVAMGDAGTFVAACEAARAAQPGWAAVPAPVRGRAIQQIGRLVEANKEALARLVTREIGKPYRESLGEVQEVVDTCNFFLGDGRRIGELCGRHLQSPCLELGGKNPLVVMPDADLDLAVEGALFSGFGTAGQRCTSLGTLIVHRDVHDDFRARFTKAVTDAPIGDPTKDVLYGPMISKRFADRFEGWLDLIRPHHSISGSSAIGRIAPDSPRTGFIGDPEAGLYYHPVVVDGVAVDDDLARTETFGPIVGVASFDTFDEALELANGPGYGLSSSIYTRDPLNVFRFRERISAGMVSVNNSTSGAEAHLPFGGNGRSGNGSRQSGIWVLDQFTRWQAMNWDYSGRLQKAQMDVADVAADLTFRLEP